MLNRKHRSRAVDAAVAARLAVTRGVDAFTKAVKATIPFGETRRLRAR